MNLHRFKASYLILPESWLIIEVITGSITLDFYTSYEMKMVNDPLYNPSYDVYVDMREAIFDGTIDQMEKYAEFILENIHIIQNRKNATIINNLHQHSYTQVFGKFNELANVPQEFRLFTSPLEAMAWLHIPYSLTQLEEIIQEMKKTPQYIGLTSTKY